MADMSTAPRDGTRILIKCYTWGYSNSHGRQVRTGGTEIHECRFHDGRWTEWAGDTRTMTTAYIDPIAWAPVPDELKLNDA